MSSNNSPPPARVLGQYAGRPIILRAYADRVELTINGKSKSFPNRDAALFYLADICRKKRERRNCF